MATFDTLESSLQDSRPIELYQFTFGTTVYRFAVSEDDVTISGDTFTAAPGMSRSRIERSVTQRGETVTFTVSAMNAVAQLYKTTPPIERSEVRAFRAQRDETPTLTVALLFIGSIKSVRFSRDGTVAEIAVQTLESVGGENLPRLTYMGSCNHFLYDQFCGVNSAAFNFIGSVLAESGSTITVDGISGSSLDFTGGFATPSIGLDFRQVYSVAGDVLTLDLAFGMSLIGQNLQVFAGCDRLIDGDCALVFDNVAEFGGFAFVPSRNIFETGL